MKKYFTLLAIPALASSLSAAFVIDDFNTGDFNVTQSGLGTASSSSSGAGMVGGTRETRAHNVSGTGNNNVNNTVNVGQLTWSQDAATSGHFHIYYGTAITGGTQLNANYATQDAVLLNIISSDISGQVRIIFRMDNGASVWSNTQFVPADVGGAAPTSPDSPFGLEFEFADFVNVSGGAFNATDIDGITFEAAQDYTSADWVFDSLETIPEPSATLLGGLGLLGLLGRRRR